MIRYSSPLGLIPVPFYGLLMLFMKSHSFRFLALFFLATSFAFGFGLEFDQNGNLARTVPDETSSGIELARTMENGPAGGKLRLSVVVKSGVYYSVKWSRGDTSLPFAISDTLTVSEIGPDDVGTYTVTVTFSDGSTLSKSIEVGLDSDLDGLPDDFEIVVFGSIIVTTGAADSDGDGVSNVQEWRDKTDPNNNADFRPRLFLSAEGGMILQDPVQDSYSLNGSVVLEAHPFDGRGFYGWLGNINPAPGSPHTILMDGNKWVSANFNYHGVVPWGRNDSGEIGVPSSLRNVVAVDAGYDHVLALEANGSIVGWGSDASSIVSGIPSETGFVKASAGYRHNLALHEDGSLHAWGTTSNGLSTIPSGLSAVADVDCGEAHNLVLFRDGTVAAWGNSTDGRTLVPVGLNTVTQISAGDNHSLALRADGKLFAWGDNSVNQLEVPAHSSRIVDICAGEDHSLALLEDGTVLAWGRNVERQCEVPEGLGQVVGLGASSYLSLALREDGSVAGWGRDDFNTVGFLAGLPVVEVVDTGTDFGVAIGDLEVSTDLPVFMGIPTLLGAEDTPFHHRISSRNSPTSFSATGLPTGLSIHPVSGLISGSPANSGAFPVTVTASNAAGSTQRTYEIIVNPPLPLITSPLAASAWIGSEFRYQIEAEHSPSSFGASGLPAGLSINPGTGIISGFPSLPGSYEFEISSTNPYGTETERVQIEVRDGSAWGANDYGQSDFPVDFSNSISLVGGYNHSLALLADGSVRTWGRNFAGSLAVPDGLGDVVALDAGALHSLALRSDGTIVGWGSNTYGQINTPDSGSGGFIAIAAGGYFSLGLKVDGTVLAWGSNDYGEREVPASLNGVVAISAGEHFGIALKSDGTVMGWGENLEGQVTIPVGLEDVVAIDCGRYHVLALLRDGTVKAWGSNRDGKATVPQDLANVVAISAGDDHSMALLASGEIVTWGGDTYGQIPVPDYTEPSVQISAGGWHSLSLPSSNPGLSAPSIISRGFAIGGRGKDFSYQILTRNVATSFTATGLPAGLAMNPSTGRISGKTQSAGLFPITVSATNSNGTTSQALKIAIHAAPPTMGSVPQLLAYEGLAFQYSLPVFNSPTVTSTSLPSGLIVTSGGTISGNPTAGTSGNYTSEFTFTNEDGQATEEVLIRVVAPVQLSNGSLVGGAIANDKYEVFAFQGAAGDPVSIRVASPDDRVDLYFEVLGPDGTVIAATEQSYFDQVLTFALPSAGAYGVRVRSIAAGRTGGIAVSYTNVSAPIVVGSEGDGGPLTNGVYETGSLPVGDVDLWSFDVDEGEQVQLRVASLQNSSDDLWLKVYSPSGEEVVGSSSNYWDQWVGFRADEPGRYVARLQMYYLERSSAAYRIELSSARTGAVPRAEDEGGPLTNGVAALGELERGDLDLWYFEAQAGDPVALRVASQQGSSDDLQLRIYSPSGELLSEESTNYWDQNAAFQAPESGTYIARVGMFYLERTSATYRIELANGRPGAIPETGDEGGSLSNGVAVLGSLVRGDYDMWYFQAGEGDQIALRAASQQGSSEDLQVRVYSPSGSLISEESTGYWDQSAGFEAPESGTYSVRIATYYLEQTSQLYRVELSHFGGLIHLNPGDEGGALNFGVSQAGSIVRGDIDTWTIPANRGDRLSLNAVGTGIRVSLQAWTQGVATPHSLTNTTSGTLKFVSIADGDYYVRFQSWYLEDEGTYSIFPTIERAPVLSPIQNQRVPMGEIVSFVVSAQSGDTGTPVLSALNLPSGAGFNPATGQFVWVTPNSPGSANFEIRATAGELFDYQMVTIEYYDPAASNDFERWILGFTSSGLNLADAGRDDDPDHDGLSNFLEYVSGNSPVDPVSRTVTSVETTGADQIRVRIRLRSDDSSLGYFTSVGNNLTVWRNHSLSFEVESSQWALESNSDLELRSSRQLDDGIWELELEPQTTANQLYLRVLVEQ
nr:putative Ig domain-containing protein [Haloferula luteola]